MSTKRFHYAFLILLACSGMSLAVGITYNTAGIFFPSVLKELGASRGALALYMMGIGLFSAFFLPVAGKLFSKEGHIRLLLSVVALIHALTTASMGLFTNVYHFYVASVFLGLAMAFFFYVAIPSLISRWFAHNVGFYVGFCFAFTAGGAIVFNPIAAFVIANYGWRMGYASMGLCSLILIFVPVLLFIRSSPEEIGLRPFGIEKTSGQKVDERLTGASASDVLKSITIIPVLVYVMSLSLYACLLVYLPSFASSKGMGLGLLAAISSMTMVGAVVGKIALGALSDKAPISALAICGISGIIGTLAMLYGTSIPSAFLAGGFLYGIGYSTCTVQSTLLIKRIYGLRCFPQIYSTIMTVYAILSATGMSLWGFLADARGGDFTLSFLLVALLSAVFALSSITALLMRKRVIWTESEKVYARS